MTKLLVALRGHRYLLLLAQLAVLFMVLVEGPLSGLGRVLWLVHVGLFLLWQPVVAGESRLSVAQAALVAVVVALVSTTLGWGWLAGWLAILSAIIGGKVVMARERRFGVFYLLVLAFLLFALLVWVAPRIVGGGEAIPEQWIHMIAMLLLLAAAAAMPAKRGAEVAELYDFIASLLLMLMLAVLLLGTTSLMALARVEYFDALLRTLFGLAAILLLLSWAWSPRPGFGGFGVFVSTYLMRLGFPFDAWLKRLIALAETVERPDDFLREALATFSALPWVSGGSWRHDEEGEGDFGRASGAETLLVYGGVHLRLFTAYAWTAALVWQGSLLLKLVVELYRAKLHERTLREMRYMQSVHETGARLTHDVKNLLQSLDGLCYAAEQAVGDKRPRAAQELAELMRRQLPVIAARLRSTLDRLGRPLTTDRREAVAVDWWAQLGGRFAREGVVFRALPKGGSLADARLPVALFDSVAENLLTNALNKRRSEPGVTIVASLQRGPAGVQLRVEDSGQPIAAPIAAQLFRERVESEAGLGIGLYQAARLAAASGWQLQLVDNRPGCVAFELSQLPASAPAGGEPSSGPCP